MLKGCSFAITGANTGVGRATAVALAERGARVLLLCRSVDRAASVSAEIGEGPGSSMFVPLDLADLASVVRAAERVAEMTPRLDALINNAGVGGARGRTHDGFELAFGVNYLGHYALTRHLLARVPSIARVVHLSSGSHSRAKALDFDAVRRPTRTLTGISEYAVSKLSVMLFHHELARREPRVVSLAADPGDVASEAWRHVPCVVRPLVVRGMKSPAEGASTSVYCATEPSLASASGASFVNERPFEASALSRDRGLARRLWERSARDVGVAP